MNGNGNEEILVVREALAEDAAFLWLMLTHAAWMSPPEDIQAAMKDAYLRTYVDDWGQKPGDLGVVALADGASPVGAAWVRLGGGSSPFKLGDAEIPELATAVLPSRRGSGVGSAMLERLVELARGRYPAILLSVRETNPAVRFYKRWGFRPVRTASNRVGGTSLVMRLDL